MRFDDVAARLDPFPAVVPPPAEAIIPVVLDGRRRPPNVPPAGILTRPAAVLVLVHPDEAGDARVVLTERATRDGHHSGEVSFPGGRIEPDDPSPADAALREATEEVALDPVAADVRIVGTLERFWIPVSNFEVTAIVALARRRPVLAPSEAEVARIVHAPIDAFLPGAPIVVVERSIRDWPLRYGTYPVEGLSVWGATARVLSQIGAIAGG